MPMLTRRQLRGWLLLLLTAVAVGLTVGLAVEARRAIDRHRAAAEATLRDHAEFAALSVRGQFVSRTWVALDPIFREIGHGRRADAHPRLPPTGVMREAAERMTRCDDCGPVLRPSWYFRIVHPGDSIEVDGPPLDAAHRAELERRIAAMPLRRIWQEWDYAAVADTLGSEPTMVYLTEPRDSTGRPLAVYGFAVPLAQVGAALIRPSIDMFPLLQQATVRGVPNDSLLALSLVRPGGRSVLELSPRHLPDTYMASIPASRFLDGLILRVRLDPAVASKLLVGGVPPARTPLLVALVAAAVLLILATAAVAWRALELADLRAEFVASVSHELRTPLAQILLFGDSLSLGTMRTRKDVRVAGGIIVGEARRLLRLVDNVLLFGRQGRTNGHAAPTEAEPLAPLVRDVVAGFAPVAAVVETRLAVVRLDDVEAPLDAEAMRQVLLNLLDNAVKYGPRGQTVSLGLAMSEGRRVGGSEGRTVGGARLWVEDEGPGIPAADRARVWRPFVRLARDVERQAAGSGIGLSVVRDIVTRHGGTTKIESTPAGGTRVVIEITDARPSARPPLRPSDRAESPCAS
ncbi:MAG TPA: HAMP domain-containing sensor histidine kinase [Gemmatimonadales bacterium]|nr:HAMP domain-containing sensor histidine kinase [Gemmatimonadales bacterium]